MILCFSFLFTLVSFDVSALSADGSEIVEVRITDVRLPYAEYYPDYDFTIRDSRYTFDPDRVSSDNAVNGCWWVDITDGDVVSPDEPFVKGHTYKLNILLKTNDGYEFRTDNFGTPYFKVYINGNEAVVDDNLTWSKGTCVEYTFAPSDYNMEVETTKLTVTEPVAGARPDFSAKTDRSAVKIGSMDSVHYIEGVAWYDCINNVWLDSSDKFVDGGVYEVNVLIETTGDFYFKTNGNQSAVKVYVNGKGATASYAGKDINHYLLVSYTFGDKKEVVNKVEVRGITEPTLGGTPDFTATPYGNAFYINAVYWTDITTSKTMKATDTFEAGHTYEIEVWIRANDGYKFQTDADGWIDITATVGTKKAEVVLPGSEISAIITRNYSINTSQVVSFVDIGEIDEPVAGATPDITAYCYTKGCNVETVQWFDRTNGSSRLMAENEKFVEGGIYRVVVGVRAEGLTTFVMFDGYNEATAAING